MRNIRRICKLLESLLNNPKDVRFEDLDKLLKAFGYEVRQPGGGSSHYVYSKKGKRMLITIPYRKPVKQCYVKQVIKLLELEDYYEENCKRKY
jgi:predicted RNA binding protein YcfA (HicA-like mRNA interferase family)